jgi:tetratricopeptide (TPR) repeat protein
MKKSVSLIALVLFFVTSMAWAETVKDKSAMKKEEGEKFKIEKKKHENEEEEWVHKGIEGYRTNNYEEAIKCFKKAIAINPNYIEAHYNLGITYHDKGMLDEAITEYKKAIALKPDYINAQYNLGMTYYDKGMLDEAIVEFNKAITIDPDSADVHHNLGYSYLKKGLNSMAADHLYRAGLLHLKLGSKKWALQAYEDLKLTNSKELEQKLYEKLHPDQKQKKSQDSN